MKSLIGGVAVIGVLTATACEMAPPPGYDMQAAAAAAIPPLPPGGANMPSMPPMPRPPSASMPSPPPMPGPAMPATGGPSSMPKPPTAPTPSTPAYRPACSAPSVVIRTEVTGAVEIKCGAPPMAPPASLRCTAPEQLTFLTRNGVATFVCMK